MAHLKSLTITTEKTESPGGIESYDDVQERVRLRAYELFEQRGREDGHDLEDWMQAESEILSPGLKLELDLRAGVKVAA